MRGHRTQATNLSQKPSYSQPLTLTLPSTTTTTTASTSSRQQQQQQQHAFSSYLQSRGAHQYKELNNWMGPTVIMYGILPCMCYIAYCQGRFSIYLQLLRCSMAEQLIVQSLLTSKVFSSNPLNGNRYLERCVVLIPNRCLCSEEPASRIYL